VIIVDDSIVRSNTAKVVIEMFRRAGAKRIIFCVGFPAIRNICPNGMDFQTCEQLIAFFKSIEEVRIFIGADGLYYLEPEDLYEIVRQTYKCGICGGCFGGKYPVIPSEIGK
jgi:amidophosphoribosyltransferase